jgi:hypothetical protein
LGAVTPSIKIRRSDAYGVAGAVVLLSTMFLPESTPQWYSTLTWLLIGGLAGAALFFDQREGGTGRSVGFALAVLIMLFGILVLLTVVL